jgi:hypothetical protein
MLTEKQILIYILYCIVVLSGRMFAVRILYVKILSSRE